MSTTHRSFGLLLALAPLLCLGALGGSADARDNHETLDSALASQAPDEPSNAAALSDPLQQLLDRFGDDVQCELVSTPPGGGEAVEGELFGTLTGEATGAVHIMGGSLGAEHGELVLSEDAEATVGDKRFRYVGEQWVDAVSVGPLSFVMPAGARRMASSQEQAARREIATGVRQMLDRYSASGSDLGEKFGIEDFSALTLPAEAGQLVVHSIRMPPEENYLETMEREQQQKLDWGKEQGIISSVLGNRRIELDGDAALRVDTMMGHGYRMISIYHWSERDPGLTTAIMAIVVKDKFSKVEQPLEAALDSIRLRADK